MSEATRFPISDAIESIRSVEILLSTLACQRFGLHRIHLNLHTVLSGGEKGTRIFGTFPRNCF